MENLGSALRLAVRGALGFGVGGVIVLSGFFLDPTVPADNLSYLPRGEGESALIGEWQGYRQPLNSARFTEDGTCVLRADGGKEVITGTYSMLDQYSARLESPVSWTSATVSVDPDYPNQPTLRVENEDGTVAQLTWFRRIQASPRPESSSITYLLFMGLPFIGGAVAALILTAGMSGAARSALGFGCGAVPATFIVLFTLISIQGGGKPDYTWGATGCGIGFALAGAIGGFSIRPALILPGAFTFGLAGAVGGYLLFLFAGTAATDGAIFEPFVGVFLALFPFLLGGGLFGGALGILSAED